MMKLHRKLFLALSLMACGMLGLSLNACSDDIPADKYYTFTGQMMSDYLKENAQYSEFVAIVNRASGSQRGVNLMDLISTYGQFTCFAPDNDAVAAFLKQGGYASVSDIPADVCDTIARTHLLNGRAYNTQDMVGSNSLSTVNMNDRYLQVQQGYVFQGEDGLPVYTTDTLAIEGKEDIRSTFRLNRSGYIAYNEANDSVENGIIHHVTAVLSSSNQVVSDLLDDNPGVKLFNQAMRLTGISAWMRERVKDESWNPDAYEPRSVYSGAQYDYCHIPETKNYGFTVFVCPDSVLQKRYKITDMQSFYDYARGIYGGEQLNVNDAANAGKLMEKSSPLRRLIAYNILNTKAMYDNLVCMTSIDKTLINPTTWYGTLDSLTSIKVEKLTMTRYIDRTAGDVQNDIYLNRGDMKRGSATRGIHVLSKMDEDYEIEGVNGVYYITNGLVDYGQKTKDDVFNTRMRVDMYYMFPELMTNNIRDGRTQNRIADSNNPDKTVTSPNYWFPNGYLDNVKVNEDGIFLFQSQHNTYWSYEGDEFNLASDVNSYDIEFNLPSVPSGTYQIRLGFTAMATRGICQFYLDGVPQGVPFDMRSDNFITRTGWFPLTGNHGYDAEELEAAKKNMHNLGWYHGPRSAYNVIGEGHPDDYSDRSYFCNSGDGGHAIVRYVLGTANLDENVQHRVRIKSVWAVGTALVMLDYFELVPKSVYGVESAGKAEDDM